MLDENGNEIELKDEDEDDDIVYTERETHVLGSTEEVLGAGFVIDEDSPEDIMNVFEDVDSDTDTFDTDDE